MRVEGANQSGPGGGLFRYENCVLKYDCCMYGLLTLYRLDDNAKHENLAWISRYHPSRWTRESLANGTTDT